MNRKIAISFLTIKEAPFYRHYNYNFVNYCHITVHTVAIIEKKHFLGNDEWMRSQHKKVQERKKLRKLLYFLHNINRSGH